MPGFYHIHRNVIETDPDDLIHGLKLVFNHQKL